MKRIVRKEEGMQPTREELQELFRLPLEPSESPPDASIAHLYVLPLVSLWEVVVVREAEFPHEVGQLRVIYHLLVA